ncbi:MAG: hypothetical protein H6Q89_5098 [Myxococcaceae bacterium]|nr:hypothetical protein [Myxococcaceae bacterium]
MQGEKNVAGLQCSQVLAQLSDYLDGRLSQAERQALEAHVGGCDVCERFGGAFAATVAGLKRHLAPSATPAAADEKLVAILARVKKGR